jgi:hypothetical protein
MLAIIKAGSTDRKLLHFGLVKSYDFNPHVLTNTKDKSLALLMALRFEYSVFIFEKMSFGSFRRNVIESGYLYYRY